MALEVQVLDLTAKNSSAASLIPQYSVVMYDVTNAYGAVPPGNANAGPVMGVNQSTGIDSNGALTASVQVGQSMEVRQIGISRVICTAVATIPGAPLYVQAAGGTVANTKAATDFAGSQVGVALEISAAAAGDLISAYLTPGLQQSLKKLGTVAAPNAANATPGTANTYAHGLGYIPSVVILESAGATGTGVVYESAAADATNITVKSTVASSTFIAYVA